MKGLRLYKSEKLCSRTAVLSLFGEGSGVKAYPLRAMIRQRPYDPERPAQMLITIPKKRVRHAVNRVLLRRRVREAYRLNRRTLLLPALETANTAIDLAFIYVANEVLDFHIIDRKMKTLLKRISDNLITDNGTSLPT